MARKGIWYEVVVGNVGTVYSGRARDKARKVFKDYVELSESRSGRVACEPVTLFDSGEPVQEYEGCLDEDD